MLLMHQDIAAWLTIPTHTQRTIERLNCSIHRTVLKAQRTKFNARTKDRVIVTELAKNAARI